MYQLQGSDELCDWRETLGNVINKGTAPRLSISIATLTASPCTSAPQ